MRDIYSDFHKEAYGSRPRHDTSAWTEADFDRVFERLAAVCRDNEAATQKAQAEAKREFEIRVRKVMGLGAGDRPTAIRWIADAEEVNGDMEYLCYKLGLPYGYFNRLTY